jgi:hypothetical protein
MSLCPEAGKRAAMSDDEFWAYVSSDLGTPLPFDEPADGLDDVDSGSPCPECGESGACAYDAEGRPMIHAPSTHR